MNLVSTHRMSYYTCTKCGRQVAILSDAPQIENASCTCGVDKVTFTKGKVEIDKPAAQNVVPAQTAQVELKDTRQEAPVVFNPQKTVGTIQKPVEPKK